MKSLLKNGLIALALVLSLANCGNRGNNNNNPHVPPFNPAWGANDYNSYFNQFYGPGNYYMGQCMTGCWCYQVPTCSYGNMYAGGGCGMQQYVVVQPGYGYMYPQWGVPQTGGSFFMGGSFGW
jgi:hypothetical protein